MARVSARQGAKRGARQPAATARALMEELEPRLLLSADAASVLGTTAALQDADLQSAAPLVASDVTQGTEAPATEVQRRELIIIDPATPDYQRLLAELGTEAADGTEREVVLLRPGEDGVAQISDILSRYTDLSAIHLISHGADGEIFLGNGVLDLDGVLANARAIQDWGQALAADGDLLIYGCNVAADGVGQTLIDTLSRLTGADVAASDDVTGSPNLGADWDLEYAAGNVETSIAVNARLQQSWHGLLAAPVAVSDAYAVNEDSTLIVAPSTSNLSHWWKLDEGGSSQTAADSGSLANNGTLGNTAGVDAADPAWTTGYVGGAALDFDGTSDYVATTSTELKTASQFTLSAWFQTDITTGAHHILWQGYTGGNGYGSGGSTSPATSEMSLSIGSYNASYDNKIVFFLGYDVPPTTANSIFIASASNFTDTAGWHHVAVTVTDVGGGVMSASLYVDGNLEGTDTGTENDRSIWNALRIGAPDAAQRLFDGRIDEVRVYQTALSGAQVQAIAQAGVLQNDTDADGDKLTVNRTPVAGPTNGVLVLNSDGSFSYTPNPNFSGSDAFTYQVSDGSGGLAQATVTINVTAVNDAPTATDRALSFDGTDLVVIAPQPNLVMTSTLTMEAMVQRTGTLSGSQIIVNKEGEYELGISAAGKLQWAFANTTPGWNWVETSYTLPADTWVHVAVTYSGGVVKTYVNGALVDTYNGTGNIGDTYPALNDLTVGGRQNTTGQRFTGLIDEVRVWNVERSAAEILAAYNTALAGNETGLVGYWRFNESSGTTAVDGSTQGYNGVLGNGVPADVPVRSLNYTTTEDNPLVVPASGVLTGATDPEGSPLTAILVSGPANAASFTLYANGSFSYTPTANFAGTDSFVFVANDGSLNSQPATVYLTITPVNDAPTLGNGTLAAVNEDTVSPAGQTVSTIFTGQFADVDAGSSFGGIAVVGNTANAGTQGSWQYSTNGGTNWFAIGTVTDGATALAISSSTLVRFLPVADYNGSPPALTVRGLENSYVAGYSTTAGSETRVTVNTTSNGGSTAIAAATATLSTSITAVNDPPVTSLVTLTAIAEDSGARLITQAELLANATDVDGPSLTATGLTISSGLGSLVNNGDGTWTYTPALNDDTSVSFSYTVTDGTTPVAGTASLDITPVNDPPVTTLVTLVAIGEDSGPRLITQVELLVNATDVDGPSLTATGLTISSGLGSLVDNGNGTWTYTPALNDDTSVTFSYTVTDGTTPVAGSATLDITPVNDAPTTSLVTLTAIGEDSGPRLITQADLLANATDVDGPSLMATGLTISSGLGSLVNNGDGTWTYTPALNDDTSVSFTYTVTDGTTPVAGTASLDITPVNDAPVTTPVTLVAIAEDSGARLITQAELLANATDVDGPSLTATSLVITSGLGSLVDNGNGTWTYTPALNDDTAVSFSYTVTDGTTPVAGSATLDITPVNDPPVTTPVTLVAIGEDSGSRLITQAELLANTTDVDGPSLTATGLTISSGLGSLVNNGDGTWTYTPALNDDTAVSFSYTVTDGTTPVAGVASLDITPVNDPPVTTPVTLVAIGEDIGPRLITQAELLANATDVDGPSPTATGLTISSGLGSLVDNGDGTWTYTPALNDDTGVSFSYTVTDGTTPVAGSATLDITPVNDPPVTTPVTLVAIGEDSGSRLITQAQLLANATDVDGPSLTATGLAISSGLGSLVDNGDGTWTYTPALNDDTSVTFSYTVTDGTTPVAGSATLDITPFNNPPVTTPVTLVAIGEDSGPRLITQAELLANATDVDGPSLTATGLTISSGLGTLVDNGDGTWTYTPALNDDTSVTFSYTVTDGTTPVAGTASLDITPVNDAPTLLAIEGGALQFLANGAVLPITGTLTVNDLDSALLTGATVTVSTNYVSGEDLLGFTDQNGVTGSFDAATGVLTLTGSATLADYQAALRSVTYSNSSDAPSQVIRTVGIAVSDGGAASALVTRDITVTALTIPWDLLVPADPGPPPAPVKIDTPPADTPPGGTGEPDGDDGGTDLQSGLPGGEYTLPGMVEPAVVVVSRLESPVSGDSGQTTDRRRDLVAVPPKFFYDAVDNIRSLLDFDSVGLPRIDNAALWKALDSMSRQMSEFGGADSRTGAIVGQFSGGAGLFLSIGFVNWVFRGGSLAAALLSTMPMWRGLDPLPVLMTRNKREDDEEAQDLRDHDQDDQTGELDQLFDDRPWANDAPKSTARHPTDA